MRKIFIGSSKEALHHAENVAALLAQAEITPVLWTEAFPSGTITLDHIDALSSEASGALFVVSPDDTSNIRNRKVKTPRVNVLFEYGWMAAKLTRSRVALCVFDGAELPSDFQGLTYIPMGPFVARGPISAISKTHIRDWAATIPSVQLGQPSVSLLHGYSGIWEVEVSFDRWRDIRVNSRSRVNTIAEAVLHLPANGKSGVGCIYGALEIKLPKCFAEFRVSDRITDAVAHTDGSLSLVSVSQSRQRIRLEGTPPQDDGFEPTLQGTRRFQHFLAPTKYPSRMEGFYRSEVGGKIVSSGKMIWKRRATERGDAAA